MILTNFAKSTDVSPVLWDLVGQLLEKMMEGEITALTLLDVFENVSQDMINTITVLGLSHEKLGPMVAKTMCLANKQLKEKMNAT